MRYHTLLAATLLAMSGTVSAEGIYVGLGVLEGYADFPSFAGNISGYNVSLTGDKTHDNGYKVYGGYDFNRYLGAEIGYNHLGNAYAIKGTVNGTSFVSNDIKAYNYYAALTGSLPLADDFSLQGKIGWVQNKIKINNVCVQTTCISTSDTSSHDDVLYGIGVLYSFETSWAVQLAYENYGKMNKEELGVGSTIGSSVSLSARYTF